MNDGQGLVRRFVAAFVAAWPKGDGAALAAFFAPNAQYHNGPLEAVRGRDAIIGNLCQMMAIGGEVDVDVLHVVGDGPVVMTERVDYWRESGRTISLRVMGVFEIADGEITAWRDYFNLDEFTSQQHATPSDGAPA